MQNDQRKITPVDPADAVTSAVQRKDVSFLAGLSTRDLDSVIPLPDMKASGSALAMAALAGWQAGCEHMLHAGADVDGGVVPHDDVMSPLQAAVYVGSAEVARLLVKHRAKVDVDTFHFDSALSLAAERCEGEELFSICLPRATPEFALSTAIVNGRVDLCRLAIQAGVDLRDENIGASMMNTALNCDNTRAGVVALLLREGAKFPSEQLVFLQELCKYSDSIELAEILLSNNTFPESPEDPFFADSCPPALTEYLRARQARNLVRSRAPSPNRAIPGQSSE